MDTLKPYAYLLINLLSVAGPVALSFDRKVNYYSYWKSLFPGLLTTAFFFIVWDILFTQWGVWSFNSVYLTGIQIINLPVEECLFFITIPFSCMFIYVIFRKRWMNRTNDLPSYSLLLVAIFFILISLLSTPKLYTSITAAIAAIITIVHYVIFRNRWLTIFIVTYLIHLIPFFVVNGILTAIPIVLYNNAENCGVRLYTIPIEDSMYSYVLLLMNSTIFELVLSSNKRDDSIV